MHPLTVLGDPVRRALLAPLAEGEVSAGTLAAEVGGHFGISHPAVSQHLKRLADEGFAAVRRDGRRRLYRLSLTAGAGPWLAQVRPFGEQKLEALDGERRRS